MSKRKPFNPFYVLLVLVGAAFVVTACAYGLMTYSALRSPGAIPSASDRHPLLAFMDQYGIWLMAAEVAVLALCTWGAIGTDDYWSAKASREPAE